MKSQQGHYIVKIYRRGEEDAKGLVGILEDVEGEVKQAFHTPEELVGLLRGPGTEKDGDVSECGAGGLKLGLPISVKGTDKAGKAFEEAATIRYICSKCVSFSVKRQLTAGSEVVICIDPAGLALKRGARVVKVKKTGASSIVSVMFDSGL